jgi:hypothetical protein
MELTKRQKEIKEVEEKIKVILDEADAMIVAKMQITESGIAPYPAIIDAPVKEEINKEITNEE